MASKKIMVKYCDQCPYLKVEPDYSEDSFEYLSKHICGKNKKVLRRWIEVFDKNKTKIPKGCPL